MAITREQLTTTALLLIEDVGLDGLTVRRLASELGVQSPALYWHVRNKRELLDAMAEAIIIEGRMGPPAPGESWQTWLLRRATSYRAAVRAHRDGVRLVTGMSRLAASTIQAFEEELAAMIALGFSADLAFATITTLSQYATGSLMQEASRTSGEPIDLDPASPLTAAIRLGATVIGDAAFERGARLIIAGAEATLAETA